MSIYLPLNIARRYLVARKSTNAINVISWVSMLGIFIGTSALIIILSVFNGFESLVQTLYNKFDCAVKVMPHTGKTFTADHILYLKLQQVTGVKAVGEVLEENALLRHGDNTSIVTLKGIGDGYTSITRIDSTIIEGSFFLHDSTYDYTVLGEGVAQNLNVRAGGDAIVNIAIPNHNVGKALDPESALNQYNVRPSGIFAIQQEFDAQYAFVPLSVMRNLLQSDSALSAYEISIKPGIDINTVKESIQKIVGANYIVKDRYELNDVLYKTMRTEKWAVYAILLLVIIIASFNMMGSLSMLVMDKQRDVHILHTLGADATFIRRIFLSEGLLMCALAATGGLVLGALFCILQQQFGFIKLGGSTFVIDAYPVHMNPIDFVTVWVAVMLIGYVASVYPARKASLRQHFRV